MEHGNSNNRKKPVKFHEDGSKQNSYEGVCYYCTKVVPKLEGAIHANKDPTDTCQVQYIIRCSSCLETGIGVPF